MLGMQVPAAASVNARSSDKELALEIYTLSLKLEGIMELHIWRFPGILSQPLVRSEGVLEDPEAARVHELLQPVDTPFCPNPTLLVSAKGDSGRQLEM